MQTLDEKMSINFIDYIKNSKEKLKVFFLNCYI